MDKGSKNGCFVNGRKILQQTLNHGDIVVFGGGSMLMTGSYQDNVDSKFAYKCSISKDMKTGQHYSSLELVLFRRLLTRIQTDAIFGKSKKMTAKRRREDHSKSSSTHEVR